MIVDVHTHTPTHRGPVPQDELVLNTAWRPDRTVAATTTWADYDAAFEGVVDVLGCFQLCLGCFQLCLGRRFRAFQRI